MVRLEWWTAGVSATGETTAGAETGAGALTGIGTEIGRGLGVTTAFGVSKDLIQDFALIARDAIFDSKTSANTVTATMRPTTPKQNPSNLAVLWAAEDLITVGLTSTTAFVVVW
jgi:hypothetical protein